MRTDILQRIAYGVKPSDLEGDARAQFFHGQGFAAMVELAEMSQEIGWKPWGSDRGLDRERYLKEGVDVLHFIANLLCLAGITDKELNQAYNAKMRTNLARQQQQGGYAGRLVGKCSSC